jgi:hypothetical protein
VKRQETRDKRQEARDKRQEARDKIQETRGKIQEARNKGRGKRWGETEIGRSEKGCLLLGRIGDNS